MTDTYAVHDYGIILDDITGVSDTLLFDLSDNGEIHAVYDFTGETYTINERGTPDFNGSTHYRGASIHYIEIDKYPQLCKRAYKNYESLFKSCKRLYDKIAKRCKELPALCDAELANRICMISGTYCG